MEKVKVVCPKCGYKWMTKSKLQYIGCPSCRRSFKKSEAIVNE